MPVINIFLAQFQLIDSFYSQFYATDIDISLRLLCLTLTGWLSDRIDDNIRSERSGRGTWLC